MCDVEIVTRAACTHSPLPLQGEASVGSFSTRHVANAAAGRSKTRRVRNQYPFTSTDHASTRFYAGTSERERPHVAVLQRLSLV